MAFSMMILTNLSVAKDLWATSKALVLVPYVELRF